MSIFRRALLNACDLYLNAWAVACGERSRQTRIPHLGFVHLDCHIMRSFCRNREITKREIVCYRNRVDFESEIIS